MNTYKIAEDVFFEFLNKQNNACGICKVGFLDKTRNFSAFIDHDHKTGTVRGLLCRQCNLLIGHANDKTDILKTAIAYLQKSRG